MTDRTDEAVSRLARTRIFGALPRDALEALAERCLQRRFRRGQLIFNEGDAADALFILTEGHVRVFVGSERGEEIVLVTLRPGDVFGELAVLDGGPRSAAAEAMEPSSALVLERGSFLPLIPHFPAIAESVLASLGAVIRRLTGQAADFVFLDLTGRVAKLLLRLMEERGEAEGEQLVLDLAMTQTELARMVGGSRQSVNQILADFERRGYVASAGRRIVMRRPDLLRRRADG